MTAKITKPTDPYSPLWAAYWEQNPGQHKAVGAEPADPPADPPNDPPADPPADTKSIDPAEYEKAMESISKLEQKTKELLDEKKQAKKSAEDAAREAAKKSGDLESLEKSWQEKLETETGEMKAKLEQYEGIIYSVTAKSEAIKLANELAIPGSADAILPTLLTRLTTEIKDGKPSLRVLDAAGNPSAMSVDDLKKEISSMQAFAPVLVGSKASGGGNANPDTGGGGKTIKRADFDTMSQRDRAAFFKDGGKVVDG